jgi:hypothetical protein
MMKRPGIASTFWFIAFVAVSILLFRESPWIASNENQDIVFGKKVYYDSGQTTGDGFVYITGSLTGDGVAYKNNTVMVACYKDRKECLFSSIGQIGHNQIGRLDWPTEYPITTWNPYEVIATGNYAVNCRKVTISVVRKTETAVWVEEPINQARAECKDANTKLYKWTIEDSRFWNSLRK